MPVTPRISPSNLVATASCILVPSGCAGMHGVTREEQVQTINDPFKPGLY